MAGCTCSDKVSCPGLSSYSITFLNQFHSNIDTISYENLNGDQVKFASLGNSFTKPFQNELCEHNLLSSCHCDDYFNCYASGRVYFDANPGLPDFNHGKLTYSMSEYNTDTQIRRSFNLKLFDFEFNLNDQMISFQPHVLHDSINISGIEYTNVYEVENDTTPIPHYAQQVVYKVFFSLKVGVIAFQERPTQTLYVKQ